MKKIILFAAILFSAVSMVKADSPKSGDINLLLKLHPFQSIEIASIDASQKKVVIEYKNANDYAGGVSSEALVDHIKVIAAGKFVVSVQAESDLFEGGNGKLSTSTMQVNALQGTMHSALRPVITPVNLTQRPQNLISSGVGTGKGNTFTVTYTGAKDNLYDGALLDNNVTEYSTIVTYTIAAQ